MFFKEANKIIADFCITSASSKWTQKLKSINFSLGHWCKMLENKEFHFQEIIQLKENVVQLIGSMVNKLTDCTFQLIFPSRRADRVAPDWDTDSQYSPNRDRLTHESPLGRVFLYLDNLWAASAALLPEWPRHVNCRINCQLIKTRPESDRKFVFYLPPSKVDLFQFGAGVCQCSKASWW